MTLIELLVAMTIFTVVILIVLGLFSTGISGQRKVIALQKVQENARFLLEFITKEIRMSTITAYTPSSLSIIRSDGVTTVDYTFTGQNIERSGDPINSDDILITGSFYASGLGTGDGLQPRITIIINAQGRGSKVEENAKINLQTTLSQRTLEI